MRHRLTTSVAALVAASLLLAGCGGGDEEEPPAQSSPSEPTTSATSEPPEPTYWPLTGLERTGDAPRHPVIVTKVDNTSSSAPQVGLGSADMVVEELVEGGYTRLAAFYYSKVPDNIGPVRSMRASDISIVPKGATVVTSGAAPITIKRINGAGIPWITEGAAGVYRETSRSAPYNLFAHLADISKRLKAKSEPPAYLPWGTEADLPKGGKASTLTADFGGHSTTWAFQKGGYVNTDSYAAEGDHFPADSVLVHAGPGRRRRLQGPGRLPGARDEVRGHGCGDAVPRRSHRPRHLGEGRPDRGHPALDQGRRPDGPRGPRVGRAGPGGQRHRHVREVTLPSVRS